MVGCESPPRGDDSSIDQSPSATRSNSSDDYLANQAAGMAAEDAERAQPTTQPTMKKRRAHPPVRERRHSPVDQPRLRR
jgi:hypothetical protein